MAIKAQDVLVLLKLLAWERRDWTYQQLAGELGMSQSEVHAGLRRAQEAGLIDPSRRQPVRKALEEFLVHGAKYMFPAERGAATRGVPTCGAAPFVSEVFTVSEDPPLVWPSPDGETRGNAFAPLYRAVPAAAQRDPGLYRLLVLVDLVRGGSAREREWAVAQLKEALAAR
jgi:DNA-binding Lrp family transcriptional regulator